ncbi:hypothetical protein DXF86_05495 [Citrobacter freundii]|nr:hypothetical protein DXF86_05495 [Citrobacter freundii]
MGRVAAQPVGQTESAANRLPAGRAKRVNPRLTAIFKEELVRKYGLFFRILICRMRCKHLIRPTNDEQPVGLISEAPSGIAIIVG